MAAPASRSRSRTSATPTRRRPCCGCKAADALANARSIVADLRRHGPETWQRFHAGAVDQLWYYRSLSLILAERHPGPLSDELRRHGAARWSSWPRWWFDRRATRNRAAPDLSHRSERRIRRPEPSAAPRRRALRHSAGDVRGAWEPFADACCGRRDVHVPAEVAFPPTRRVAAIAVPAGRVPASTSGTRMSSPPSCPSTRPRCWSTGGSPGPSSAGRPAPRDRRGRAGDRIAIELTNRPEYLETFYAALKLGCVPVNVNFRYTATELHYLLDNSDAKVVVHGPEFTHDGERGGAADRRSRWRPLLLEAGEPYEQRARRRRRPPPSGRPRPPSGDDLIFLYTGGTTGMPKGVMWRNDDLYVALWVSAHPHASRSRPTRGRPRATASAAATLLPAAPLMHGTGLFAALAALAGGGTVVLVDRQGLDAELIWDTVARERVADAHHRRRRVRASAARRARRAPRSLGPHVAARDHVVGRALQPRGEARAARPPARAHHRRLARRVGGPRARAARRGPTTRRSRRRGSR